MKKVFDIFRKMSFLDVLGVAAVIAAMVTAIPFGNYYIVILGFALLIIEVISLYIKK